MTKCLFSYTTKWSQLLTLGRSRVEWPLSSSESILRTAITSPWSHQPMRLKYDDVIMVGQWGWSMMMSSWSDVIIDQWDLNQSTSHTGLNKFVPVWTNPYISQTSLHILQTRSPDHSCTKAFSNPHLGLAFDPGKTSPNVEMSQVCICYTSHIHPVFKEAVPRLNN